MGRAPFGTSSKTDGRYAPSSFLSDYHGRDLTVSAELALDSSGKFLALRASNISNIGAYAISFVPLTKGTELMSSILPRADSVGACTRRVLQFLTDDTLPQRGSARGYVCDRAPH